MKTWNELYTAVCTEFLNDIREKENEACYSQEDWLPCDPDRNFEDDDLFEGYDFDNDCYYEDDNDPWINAWDDDSCYDCGKAITDAEYMDSAGSMGCAPRCTICFEKELDICYPKK